MTYKNWLVDSIDPERLEIDLNKIKMEGIKKNYCDLIVSSSEADITNREMYDKDQSVTIYRNFLNWLFQTFKTTEDNFRAECISQLNLTSGCKVLATSCGLGEDVDQCCAVVGVDGLVHGQDLSKHFIEYASKNTQYDNSVFTVSNALDLPYKDNYFDAVYHFGGINLFGDLRKAISEMERVCKVGGRVVFGDESIAPHLRDTEYGKMLIKNNKLWEEALPLNEIPVSARNLFVRYVLGNCFYLIGFDKGKGFPEVNIDVPHLGYRGGSIRTRYYGEVEGVELDYKTKIYEYAKENNTTVSKVLEDLISRLN